MLHILARILDWTFATNLSSVCDSPKREDKITKLATYAFDFQSYFHRCYSLIQSGPNDIYLSCHKVEVTKTGIVKFLGSGLLPEMEVAIHLLVGASDTRYLPVLIIN